MTFLPDDWPQNFLGGPSRWTIKVSPLMSLAILMSFPKNVVSNLQQIQDEKIFNMTPKSQTIVSFNSHWKSVFSLQIPVPVPILKSAASWPCINAVCSSLDMSWTFCKSNRHLPAQTVLSARRRAAALKSERKVYQPLPKGGTFHDRLGVVNLAAVNLKTSRFCPPSSRLESTTNFDPFWKVITFCRNPLSVSMTYRAQIGD